MKTLLLVEDNDVEGVPVFIVTGLAVASDQWAQSLGADGLVKKPVDTEAMLKKIEERAG